VKKKPAPQETQVDVAKMTEELKGLRATIWDIYTDLFTERPGEDLSPTIVLERLRVELLECREEATRMATRRKRERLPDERQSVTHKFSIAGHEGYLIVGLYPDGRPGEIFIRMAKAGSVVDGLTDSMAIAVSVGLQQGVPIDVFVRKYAFSRFEPSGFTPNPQIKIATSIVDYIFRWIGLKFCPEELPGAVQGLDATIERETPSVVPSAPECDESTSDAPTCSTCGAIMRRAGSCYSCPQCAETTGCG
jgi:ribonucleoside-diphosphate reductase alpha chain